MWLLWRSTPQIANDGKKREVGEDFRIILDMRPKKKIAEMRHLLLMFLWKKFLRKKMKIKKGISTAAKLPDYRGGDGMWTNRDQGTSIDKTKYVENISCALPTLSHMAIAELVHRGIIKSVVSTNVDGLHMRAGVEKSRLSELHGNSYLETCDTCGEKYLRTQDVLQNQTEDHRLVNRHWCGKYCEKEGCGGMLLDNIVAFGENLPEDELNEAIRQSKKGDLALVLDTTMMVQPACLLPKYIYKKPKGKMVICNLQTTPYDKAAALRIQGHIDDMW